MQTENLVERLRKHAASRSGRVALRFLEDDDVVHELTFAGLDARVRSVASLLQQLGGAGERAVILLPSGLDYAVAFYACLYAGVIAVPAYPQDGGGARHAGRLDGILSDATPRFVLTRTDLRADIEALLPKTTGVQIVEVDAVQPDLAADWRETRFDADAVAFLQYTSGSTSQPKGVCVSHGNLVANERAIQALAGATQDDIFVSWLPLYHDMGLIGGLLNPLFVGYSAVLMSPGHFLERPRRWLEAISRYNATLSGGPDFAYSLCVDRISDESLSQLVLSSWRFAFSGSEFVRCRTLRRFAERFKPAGFDARALAACYGLAEATLLVSGSELGVEPVTYTLDTAELAAGRIVHASEGTDLVACGRLIEGHALRIMRVDGSTVAEPDEIGEIWVAGPSVAQGYWRNAKATHQAFVERDNQRWLRTGDLGFVRDGTLVVAGRLKDLLIVRGQNIYPTDVEQAVEAGVRSARKGRVAAFAVDTNGHESIGVAAEFSRTTLARTAPELLAHAIGEAVLRQCQEYPAVIVLLNPRGMPLTTSGKLQRSACSAGWSNNMLDSFMVIEHGRSSDGRSLTGKAVNAPATETERAVATIWCEALGVETVGREDDFFVLGGNSISAGQVAATIRERFGRELELRSFFDAPTLAAFASRIEALVREGASETLPPIQRASPQVRNALSHAQERLWFLWNMDPGGTAYTVASTIRLKGGLDHSILSRAITEVVRRHDVLRTTFVAKEGRGSQVVHDAMDVAIRFEDLRRHTVCDRGGYAAALTKEELARPFDLVNGPLLRAVLLRLADDEHELLLLAHHIIVDGLSLNVLLQELAALYRSFSQDNVGPPPLPMIQYADFAAWQRKWLASGEGEQQLAYWRARLGETHPVLALPLDRPRPVVQSHGGGTIGLEIDGTLAVRLKALAGQHRASLFMLLLGAYHVLLHRYTGQTDLRVGVPVAGRRHVQLERLIGCFVNTLVMRADIVDRMSFSELLAQVKETVIGALAHQDLPFELLVDGLKPERSGGHNPLFQAKFNYMTAPRGFDAVEGLAAEARIVDLAGSHFDLALDIVDGADGIKATFNFATDLFESATIARLAAQFHSLLGQIAEDAERPLSDFSIDEANRQVVRSETATFDFVDIVSLHCAAAADRETAVAVRCGGETMTFDELDRRSNSLARELVARGVTREAPVALWIERSPAFVAALLGVLRAGGAFVPLDPKWPLQRVQGILKDGNIGIVMAAGETLEAARALDCLVLDANDVATGEAASGLSVDIHPEQIAYVIYTSGSTGTPKGVAVSHGALANYVQALLLRLEPVAGTSMAMVSTVAADLGHTVLFSALATGATLNLLPPDASFDADLFARAMREADVGFLKIVPSHLRGLLHASRSADLLPRDVLVLGGEACDPTLLAEIRQLRPQCRIVNHYGPTETTVGAVAHACEADAAGPAPIGLPLANLGACVLDDMLNEVPIGVVGELYIGGAGLARGYLGRPGLTAERFVPDPFGLAGARLYRTGDLVRCDQAGRLVFLGRADDQIKLRGYRIELDEVSRAIKALDEVEDAVVVARALGTDQQRQELVAYYVARSGMTLGPDAIKQRLSTVMPDYMVPPRIVGLARLPLTSNGKIDRKALPEPDEEIVAVDYSAPRGEVEQAIAAVWQDVLGREQIGRNDNFFELGGDSILSLQIIARLRKRGVRLTPKQVFGQQTIAALATVATVSTLPAAKDAKPKADTPTVRDLVTGPHHLLPIQARFFEQVTADRHHWNQALLLAPQSRLNWDVLRRALVAVVDHHDALRLRFEEIDGTWRAEHAAAPAASELLAVREGIGDAAQITAVASAAQASLSLSGPLLRAVGMELEDGGQRLLIAVHHLVIDGVSWRVLLEDLASAYDQLLQGAAAATLPPTSDSYASWGARLRAYASSQELAAELPFWLRCRAGTELPCDCDHEEIDRVGGSEEVSLVFDEELTSRLLKEAPAAYRTQVNDLLLTGLARAIWHWSGHDDVLIELEGHGREDVFSGAELSRTVGWFTTAFPLRLQGGSSGDAPLIKSMKETLRAVPNRGLGYGVLRYLGAEADRLALARSGEPRIVFNYLGQFDGSLGDGLPFRIAPESAGATRSATAPLRGWLNINGEVRDRRLRLSFGYGRKRYRRETIARLVQLYETALRELVDHCTSGACGITPSDVVLSDLTQAELDRLATTLDWRSIEDVYPLSPMQQGMLFHALRDGDADVYVNQVAIELIGIDAERLRAAWQVVSDRHATLRTGFIWRELSGSAQQVVYRQAGVPFVEEDWRERTAALEHSGRCDELDAALADVSRRERATGFDVSRPPLQRVRLIRLGEHRHWLIWTHHHIVLDGWSSARLVAQVLQHVNGVRLPAVQGSYRDYIAWLKGRERASSAFWPAALVALEAPTFLADALASDHHISVVSTPDASGHARLSLLLDAKLTERLKAFAKRERVTLNTLVQGAWAQVLRRYVGQDAVCFGVTVSGRPAELPDAEEMVGLFINTLPIVDSANPQSSIGTWLRQLQEQNLALREHGWTPLYEIQRLAGHAGRALFDSILVFENYPIDEGLRGKGDRGPRLGRVEHVTPTNYALAVAVFAGSDGLNLDFNYDRARLDGSQMMKLRGALVGLLEQIVADAGRPQGILGAPDKGEIQRVLEWSGPAVSLSASHPTVVAQIEATAARSPSALALVCGKEEISYGELNARANRLARRLRRHGIGPDRLVGLALGRSADMLVALLAVLKAGGAYLPLDPDYPAGRLVHMLRDSGARLVLTQHALRDRLAPVLDATGVEAWRLDEPHRRNEDDSNLAIEIRPESLAYVIYTSGSTGTPKGVAVAHGPLAMHCQAIGRLYRMQATDREFQSASINFDIAHERWLVPLMTGGSLVLPPRRALLIDDLLAEIERRSVTTVFLPPAYADQLSDVLRQLGRKLALRLCIVGGEAWSDVGVRAFRQATDVELLVNAYGPTETVIAPMAWTVDETAVAPGRYAPIGRPIGSRTAYILDADLNPLPVGVTGELFIGGVGLARGYLNRSALTAERFIPDQFGGGGDRLYRTGDLARWRADGVIEYVGRSDNQVKVRGFRIELGEVEARLLEQRGVRSAVVVAHESATGRQLIGYVSGEAKLDGRALRSALSTALPDYMVPSLIVVLEQLPLTPNGKIDRRALPSPQDDGASRRGYAAPEGEIETELTKIWSELLGLDRVGRDDHFFELGGHSLLAVRLVSRVSQEWDVPLQVSDLFRHPELAQLARVISISLIEREFDAEELQDVIASGS
ncbi:non-ribosomal peptide synthetase [Bradyrhizobium sp. LHD-71]|uniref:non-ribosomal peptide synthetase n=1 Tax=Bradyrhizobium sp. LHD-71 TaxID=3072141 RepID=UPI00280F55D1|nr:non-ribosomal peptide synthetase [Bradyrhizobium sp. LHD-71]MDQ8728327.1 amino acid adenylation domain-containing protein [Bradyrhizobium sp. LHD-71]